MFAPKVLGGATAPTTYRSAAPISEDRKSSLPKPPPPLKNNNKICSSRQFADRAAGSGDELVETGRRGVKGGKRRASPHDLPTRGCMPTTHHRHPTSTWSKIWKYLPLLPSSPATKIFPGKWPKKEKKKKMPTRTFKKLLKNTIHRPSQLAHILKLGRAFFFFKLRTGGVKSREGERVAQGHTAHGGRSGLKLPAVPHCLRPGARNPSTPTLALPGLIARMGTRVCG